MGELQTIIELIIGSLATYGIAVIVANYDGPFNILVKLRESKVGSLFTCSVCLSVYVAAFVAIFMGLSFFEYLAILGLAVLLERNT